MVQALPGWEDSVKKLLAVALSLMLVATMALPATAEVAPDEEDNDASVSASTEEEPRARRRLDSRWFWSAFALTALSGVGLAITGAMTINAHDQYMAEQTDQLLRDRGMSLQLTTNVLIGITGGFALITALLAIFTDWNPETSQPERE